MKKNEQTPPVQPPRLLVGCNKEADTCRVLEELEKLEDIDIQSVSDQKAFQKALIHARPGIVIVSNEFGAVQFLKSVRETHPEIPYIIILESESSPGVLRKGINIYLLKHEMSGLCSWVETLLTIKQRNFGKEIHRESVDKLQEAVSLSLVEKIVSPALDGLRVEARMFAKPPKERDEALRNWTMEIERKKMESATPPPNAGRQDPLIPYAVSSLERPAAPAAPASDSILNELGKLRADFATQFEQINAQVKEINKGSARVIRKKRNNSADESAWER